MFLALTSAVAAPGTSTTALGLALCAPTEHALYVEADPCGGSFLHSRYFRAAISRRKSIVRLAEAADTGKLAEKVREQTEPVPHTGVHALTGLWTTRQAMVMRTVWGPLGGYLAEVAEAGVPVVADLGRYGHRYSATDLMVQADVVAVVTRATLPELTILAGVLPELRRDLESCGSAAELGVILVGSAYPPAEVRHALQVDVLATLPDDPRHAAVFSEGVTLSRRKQARSSYLRALRDAWKALADNHFDSTTIGTAS
ncbi:hypothetical protein ACFYO1_01705 [Nocardia sp. NPDC006044]|uniref:hypothetical protein n=1 Tax=Nocardia sp. NPDC006044 TaxID=3364306 RepID=UPI0036B60C52